jgi:adenine-specific DNA-methyltransferase
MSRLTDLIARAKAKDLVLGQELEHEFKILSSRRSFGLNFERHRPEIVELPSLKIRKGDKVRILEKRGSEEKGDQRIWHVNKFENVNGVHTASLKLINSEEPELTKVASEDLVVLADFKDYIYPGLVSTGKVQRGNDKPFHSVINGENFHALQALTFTHRGKIDAIYIDPPYNSGARDWKYNNDYVEKDDNYRHSKWLAFIERRLKIARQIMNPNASALVCSIDEKEYLNLGLLLEQIFPDAKIQMVSNKINAKGIIRDNEFSRTNEFIFFIFLGNFKLTPEIQEIGSEPVRWASLRRSDVESARGTPKGGPKQFYPIYVEKTSGKIKGIGRPLKLSETEQDAPEIEGCFKILPIRDNGEVREMNWGLTVPTLKERLKRGFVKASFSGTSKQKITLYYLTTGQIEDIDTGRMIIKDFERCGAAVVEYREGKQSNPTTQWAKDSHNAQSHGSDLLKALIPNREFPFPKSLYAVEDVLRIVAGNNKSALILDFFAGSGTTAHAVMRLNKQDGGNRECISVTNNEVAASEQKELREDGLRPGDEDWEKWGICEYITKTRIYAAITGINSDGDIIHGDYKFNDEFPMGNGFEENAEFFNLTYETPVAVSHKLAFERIAPLLWMRAGSKGRRIDELPSEGWSLADTYGLITDLDKAAEFCSAVGKHETVKMVFIFTNDERRFQSMVSRLTRRIEPVRLLESYLSNFRFSIAL